MVKLLSQLIMIARGFNDYIICEVFSFYDVNTYNINCWVT